MEQPKPTNQESSATPPPQEENDEPSASLLNLDTIPVEVLLQIFNFVNATDLLRNVSLVSKYFHAILSNEMTWKIKMEKRWGGTGDRKYPPLDLPPSELKQDLTRYSKIYTTTKFPYSRACVKREEQIHLWTSNIPQASLNAHIGCIDSVHLFSRNNTMLLACGSRDRTISVWNVEQVLKLPQERKNEAKLNVLNRAHDGWIWDFAVNSTSFMSCSWDTTAKMWDENMCVVGEFKSNTALLSISTTESTTAIGAFNKKILLIDPRTPSNPPHTTISTHTRSVLSVGIDPTFVISCGEDGLVARHDLRNTSTPHSSFKLPPTDSIKTPYPTTHSFRETLINLPYFYVGDNTGNIHLIDLLDFKIISTQKIHNAPVRGVFNNLGSVVSCSRDGKLAVSSPCLGLKRLRNVDVGDKIELPCVHSLDNVVACGGGDGLVRVWGRV